MKQSEIPNYDVARKMFYSLHPDVQQILTDVVNGRENTDKTQERQKAVKKLIPKQTLENFEYIKAVINFNKDYLKGINKLANELLEKHGTKLGALKYAKPEVDMAKYNELFAQILQHETYEEEVHEETVTNEL